MSPEELRDQLAGRVARLEANVARIQSDIENLRQVPVETARLAEKVAAMEGSMSRIELKFDRRLDEIEPIIDRSEQRRDDEQREAIRDSKRQRWALVGIGMTVMLSTLGTLAVTLLQAGP